MAISVPVLAAAVQALLTQTADDAARHAGLVRRRRKITGAGFVRTLVLGYLADPHVTVAELAETLGVSEQALQKRFTLHAADGLRRVLAAALDHVFAARPETIPLLRRFPAVVVEDSTTVRLPACLARAFPGCGSSDPDAGQAGWKLLVRLDATTGAVRILPPQPARASDRTLLASWPAPPSGSLRLTDLGFFDLTRLARDGRDGVWFLSRVPALLSVREHDGDALPLADWLSRSTAEKRDATVTLGTKVRLTCRLIALRVPDAVAEERLRRLRRRLRKKGRTPSQQQRVLCHWTVLATNLPAERFTAAEVAVLYRVRWQVELLFKRWKSGGGLGASRGRTGPRVLCEAYAKLLAMVVQHWATLLGCGPLGRVSPTRACRQVRRQAGAMAAALEAGGETALPEVLERLRGCLARLPNRPRRRRPSTRQLLFKPKFAA